MILLKDNSTYYSDKKTLEEYLSLQEIANRKVSELIADNGHELLIYPHSFNNWAGDADKLTILSLQTQWKRDRCTQVILNTGNLAGFIGFNGNSLTILSRFSKNEKEDLFLHYMLYKTLGINIVNLQHEIIEEPVFNFLLFLFPKLLNDALSQGIYKEYQRNEYNDANVRGPIDINRHIKSNLPFNGRIAYHTREFRYDNPLTQLIRHTIEYIRYSFIGKRLLENDIETQGNVSQIITATPNYNRYEREKIIKKNLKIIIHPYYTRYTPLQKLCLRILRHEKIKYGHGDNKISGILFDVSYLWEEYINTILSTEGFKHPNNKKGIGRIYLTKDNHFYRYPDFYRKSDQTVIDAKYKREISRDDIHQLITYMYRFKGKKGIFIQPGEEQRNIESHFLLGHGEDHDALLEKYIFHIPQDKIDYNQFTTGMVESEDLLRHHYGNKA